MSIIEFIIRLGVTMALLFWLVLRWAVVPYLDSDMSLDLTIVSTFFGNREPVSWVRDLLLASRFFFGLTLTTYVFLPALCMFVEFDHRPYTSSIAIILGGLTVLCFFGSLVIQQLFFI